MEKFKDRKFRLLLYPDDETHVSALNKLMAGGYLFAAIIHNKDIWSSSDENFDSDIHKDGEPKKEHCHIVLKFSNPRWSTALAAELGIAHNYIRPCSNLDASLRYLIHDGYRDKYQYDIEEVFGELSVRLKKNLDDDEGSRVLQIVEMIDNSPSTSYRDILVKCCKAGLYGEFRRLGVGVKYLLDERRQSDLDNLHNEHERDVALSGFNDRQKI